MRLASLILTLSAALLAPWAAAAQPLDLRSPDGRNAISLGVNAQGSPSYTVSRNGAEIIAPSTILIELERDRIGYGLAVTGSERRSADESYDIVAGRADRGRDHYNELTVHLTETGGARRRMDVVLRAYDDGVAFRTVLPVQPQTAAAIVRGEESGFNFPRAYRCWGFNVGRFGSSHEGEFDPVDTSRTREHNLFDVPFLCETGQAAFLITEADLIDFAGMYLTGRGDGGLGLRTRLSPSLGDPRLAVRTRIGQPIRTPWRVVMLADQAGEFAASTLISDLATPSRIADTSWIRPGRSVWDWWNGGRIARISTPGTNTETSKAFIDFAAANGFEYAMIDEGWYAGAGGGPVMAPGVDITANAPNFDLRDVAAYARSKGVRLWLWLNWRALDAQMEEALALYSSLGIAGIKVDFMDRDDQEMVNWYTRLFAAAARHRLMVNLHGAFPPRGLARTWPNFVTQEGVLGAEYNKWSRRITAGHNVMLAYTRNVIGPNDYTPGGFRNVAPADFEPRNDLPFVQTTRAHGLSMYVVYDSPLAIVADSPDTYADMGDGLDFIRAVPAAWDETRFIEGEVGEYIAVARREGRTWYVGAMNGEAARTVTLPLSFLGNGRYDARLWSDGATPAAVVRTSRTVSAADTLTLDLAATGGAVAILTPRR